MSQPSLNYDSSNFPLAFLVSVGASLSAGIGAASVRFGSLRDPKLLSLGTAMAAGVMLYISLHEILNEAIDEFKLATPENEAMAHLYGTLFFFVGAIFTAILEYFMNRFQYAMGIEEELPSDALVCPTSSDFEKGGVGTLPLDHSSRTHNRLFRTALFTGLALAIHNLPEGLATFVSMAKNFTVGLPLTMAIALHNIPEGIAVAIPVLYATGSRWKGFLWGTASSLTGPFGALLGWAILATTPEHNLSFVYGVLFGFIAGMMTYVSIAELIPTALQYHQSQQFVAIMVFAGMFIMASSLVLFELVKSPVSE